MSELQPAFYFDFIDPLSYLVEHELRTLGGTIDEGVARVPFEVRPPPIPLTEVEDPALASRWEVGRARALDLSLRLAPPRLVPWSRKAHELHLFAVSLGLGPAVRAAVFEAYFERGQDIGRIDVLVGIGRGAGLDATETKAVLDVDRFEQEVLAAREAAVSLGVDDAPVLLLGASRLQGFHNRSTLSTFLREP